MARRDLGIRWTWVGLAGLILALTGLGCPLPCDDDTCADDDVADDDTGDDDTNDDDTGDDDTGDDDTGDDDSAEWGSNAFWTGSSILDVVLDLDSAPQNSHWEVRAYLSDEGFGVDPEVRIVAHSMSSLDLLALDDGLVVMASVDVQALGHETLGEYQYGYLYALSTANLLDWGTHVFPVYDTTSERMTDPALEQLPDGTIRAIYYSTPMEAEGDPVYIPGDHELKVAYREGTEFYEEPDPVYAAEGLADPTSCEYDGVYHVFATQFTTIGHATGESEFEYETDAGFSPPPGQVPYCLSFDDELWLITQGGGGWPPPTAAILQGDGSLGIAEPLWSDEENLELGPCTSPVLAYYDDTYVVICAVFVD